MKKVLVVYKTSAYELYSRSPDAGVQAFLEKQGPDVERMVRSHHIQEKARATVMDALDRRNFEVKVVPRGDFKAVVGVDLVITVGGDGTFLQASHAVRDVPMVGVNSDPEASVGFFCACGAAEFDGVIRNLDTLPRTTVHRLETAVNGQPVDELALNDVFYAHVNPAAVTRYRAKENGKLRFFKSSGFLVCTAAGSTGWMYQDGGEVTPITDERIQFLSRSVRGETPRFANEVTLYSLTHEARLFIDGTAAVKEIALGSEISIRGGRPLTVIGDLESKRKFLE